MALILSRKLILKRFARKNRNRLFLVILIVAVFYLSNNIFSYSTDNLSTKYEANKKLDLLTNVAFVVSRDMKCSLLNLLHKSYLKRLSLSLNSTSISKPLFLALDGYNSQCNQRHKKQIQSIDILMGLAHRRNFVLLSVPDNDESLTVYSSTRILLDETQWEVAIDWIAKLGDLELSYWRLPRIRLQVFGNNRIQSLERLYSSLLKAHFLDDIKNNQLSIHIHLDGQANLQIEDLTKRFLSNSPFANTDQISVQLRLSRAGLLHSVVESWYPVGSGYQHEYAVFLEDDVELSPLFYHWIKYSLLSYRYSNKNSSTLMGISLYTPKVSEVGTKRKEFFPIPFTNKSARIDDKPFLLQLPCSWGALFFPEFWCKYRQFMQHRVGYQSSAHPNASSAWIVENLPLKKNSNNSSVAIPNRSRVNTWNRSWKRHLIELMYYDPHYMIYPKIPFFKVTQKKVPNGLVLKDANKVVFFPSFSTNHMDSGDHVHISNQTHYENLLSLYKVPLLVQSIENFAGSGKVSWASNKSSDIEWPILPHIDQLATFDLFHEIIV